MSLTLDEELKALEGLDLEDLRLAWRRLWGPPPKLRSRELLAHAFAYKLQTAVFGELPAPLRRRMAELARRFAADPAYRPTPGPALSPGCSLVREWGGVRHEVKVLEDGFGYQDKTYASLSALAEHITGAKRSGVLFFGLKPKEGGRA
jgi:hypothetical protein